MEELKPKHDAQAMWDEMSICINKYIAEKTELSDKELKQNKSVAHTATLHTLFALNEDLRKISWKYYFK